METVPFRVCGLHRSYSIEPKEGAETILGQAFIGFE